ncbi:hypothetical protein GCM10009811_27950 [Nostocoides veronense]|uniref:IrrE N-terminal-like domain-containing protein n=1 Tax=Nostocoides veronense TaxID=330836 RepID=A0ABP4Y8G3_9MICO
MKDRGSIQRSPARQRFTLLHEFKHIIDHGACDRLYRDVTRRGVTLTARQQAETAADMSPAAPSSPSAN